MSTSKPFATKAQKRFLKDLHDKLGKPYDEMDMDRMDVFEAQELIDDLKKQLWPTTAKK